ncbi:hypothetical protein LLG96_02425 [bacterium]|nr:hypothetical protein [bacterium]
MSFAADVTNVDYTVNGNDEVVVIYDLRADGPCTIRLEVLREDDLNFLIVPRTVKGDVGRDVEPGRRKLIVWQVYKDIRRLQGDVYVRVVVEDEHVRKVKEKKVTDSTSNAFDSSRWQRGMEMQESERINLIKNLYNYSYNDSTKKASVALLEGIFDTPTVYYSEGSAAFGIPLFIKGYYLFDDITGKNEHFSLFAGIGLLSNGVYFERKKSLLIDYASVHTGFMAFTSSHTYRLIFDISAGLMVDYPLKKDYYFFGEITREQPIERYKSGEKQFEYKRPCITDGCWVPYMVKISFERRILQKSYVVLQTGCWYGLKHNWYYKDELDNFIHTGANEPYPLDYEGLPDSPYIEGFVPFFSLGFRLF